LCEKWYHTDCLGAPSNLSQESYIHNIADKEECADIPFAVLTVAFQPTARGGLTHFTTGNICIISQARNLLYTDERETVERSPWMAGHLVEESRVTVEGEDWIAWLKFELGMDEEDVEEALIVEGQLYYTCPECNDELLI
jgi:hypothetical protein